MPCVEIYQSRNTDNVALCSFVFCKELGGGYTPTGPLLHFPLDHFLKNAVDIVTEEFGLFYTREYGIKSELHDEMTKAEQRKFLLEHSKVILSWPIKNKPVNVYTGQYDELYGHLAFPFDRSTFAGYLLEALSTRD